MLLEPKNKYRPFQPFAPQQRLHQRSWPDQVIKQAPRWMSTDLRDGNQALFDPMDGERKLRMFKMLVEIGVKEIEVAFPSASQTDFDFVRHLIENDLIPDDVTIEVLTQARAPLISRTFESVRGAKRVIMHLYNALAPNFRHIVFNEDRAGVRQIAETAAQQFVQEAKQQPHTQFIFQYSPEVFSGTEIDFACEVCNAVTAIWQPSAEHKCIINLPATVEMSTPNLYADQIEWMHRNLERREAIWLSVHPHNDRGTAVAAAELSIMAGADRIEGCLFGNGERTGNVDLVTLALNLYSQGISPGLDFSRINEIARTVEHCTQLPIHPRHPYVGDLVFTAFSGSHQDAIKKGLAAQKPDALWQVPYLPIDPADLGRSYESIIRINSQSGKGGIAYLLEAEYGLALPRRLQIEFSNVIQHVTDSTEAEISAAEIWRIFCAEYLEQTTPIEYIAHHLSDSPQGQGIQLQIRQQGREQILRGVGNGPIDAVLHALGSDTILLGYEEHSIGQGSDARAAAFIELATAQGTSTFGVGIDENIITASIRALLCANNRLRQNRHKEKAVA